MDKRTFIVAEIGINHNGSVRLAKELIGAAKETGADAVKFQTFVVNEGHSSFYKTKKELDKEKIEELSFGDFLEIRDYCRKKKIVFFSTPFDVRSADILRRLDVPVYKIASPEIVNIPLLRSIAAIRKPVIISTGMADLAEIRNAVGIFQDYFGRKGALVDKDLKNVYTCFRKDIILLHCVSVYPAAYDMVNLRCIETLRSKFRDCEVGLSDHTVGIEIPIAAVALGASLVEKHFTVDRRLSGPDHKMSMMPREFKGMVAAIRNIELALGDGVKRILPEEEEIGKKARKSIVACRTMKRGEVIAESDITVKRPGGGISPFYYDLLRGKRLLKAKEKDEFIGWRDVEDVTKKGGTRSE